ncbi:hypothetical protein DFR29_106107 [Tahibacter aquaticus]|uniref:Uncharacterized protein n=1 Tax=Tahibacter aquaticus TaxID=520092 RepID=A0A4R6YY84_9GAMM|nr:DUF6587 family protein [Tahibacter aquaticus]TDR43965.1 hypothetical protein DFR29_106107 [Tahibacter aquaticus]
MNSSLAWQYAIIGVLVALSALSVLRKYLPSVWGRALAGIATLLQSGRSPGWLQRLGTRLRARIPAAVGSSCGSSGGCSSCGACGSGDSSSQAKAGVQPITLQPPRSR